MFFHSSLLLFRQISFMLSFKFFNQVIAEVSISYKCGFFNEISGVIPRLPLEFVAVLNTFKYSSSDPWFNSAFTFGDSYSATIIRYGFS